MSEKKGIPLYVQILAAMLLGVAVGVWSGKGAAPLGELGKLVIQLIKAAAAPLLFFAIVDAIVKTSVGLRSAGRMAAIACFNATIALGIGLGISNLLQPGRHLSIIVPAASAVAPLAQKLDFAKTVNSLVPTSFVQPFAENAVLTLVVLALLFGFGLRRARTEQAAGVETLLSGVEAAFQLMQIVLGWIIRLIPIAVFGVVAKAAGEHGLAPLKGLSAYVGAGVLGIALHILITFQAWLVFYVKIPLKRFWSAAREPVIYAMGANSSLATLPVTLKALDTLGVSKASSTLGACVGTNLNNDGIILYEAMAVLFVAQAHGLDLSLGQQALAAALSLVAAAGIAGVPEAGFVSLSLVLATVGLPMELLPLLLTVDWIIARARSVGNSLSDMLVSIILDRWEGRRFT